MCLTLASQLCLLAEESQLFFCTNFHSAQRTLTGPIDPYHLAAGQRSEVLRIAQCYVLARSCAWIAMETPLLARAFRAKTLD